MFMKQIQSLCPSQCVNVCVCVGRLNVGDQLLVCDGVSLLEVTHDEAAQALKDAMDMESVRIQLSLPDSLRTNVE